MKQLAVATVLVVFCSLAWRAQAGEGEGCCACLPLNGNNQTAQDAFFCVAPNISQINATAQRCEQIGPDTELICYKTVGNSSCRSQLTDAGIDCPLSAAPAVSSLNLATLAVSLAGLGGLLLRQRRRRR